MAKEAAPHFEGKARRYAGELREEVVLPSGGDWKEPTDKALRKKAERLARILATIEELQVELTTIRAELGLRARLE